MNNRYRNLLYAGGWKAASPHMPYTFAGSRLAGGGVWGGGLPAAVFSTKRTYSRKYIGCRDVIGGRNAASPQATALITY